MSGAGSLNQGFPQMPTLFVDPTTGRLTAVAYRFLLSLWQRTGGSSGTNIINNNYFSGLLSSSELADAPPPASLALMFESLPEDARSNPLALLFAESVDATSQAGSSAVAAQMPDVPTPQPVAHPGLWALAMTTEP